MSYDIITNRLIELIEQTQLLPWQMPWNGGISGPANLLSNREYTGMNYIMLEMTKIANKYTSNYWLTYKQARKCGGYVKKGEKGTPILVPIFEKEDEEDDDGNIVDTKETLHFKVFYVFNTEQTNIVADLTNVEPKNKLPEKEVFVNGYLQRENIKVIDDCKAYYNPTNDFIGMPKFETFHSIDFYYLTMLHEIAHSTGHSTRLNRVGVATLNKSTHTYSYEELVAELTATFVGNDLGLVRENSAEEKNSASYLKNWLSVIRESPKMLQTATQEAEKAVKYILNGKN
jgi:antirestriction protein ArdC